MNCSVKFFEPIVICGLEALSGFLVIRLASCAGVAVVAAALLLDVVLLLLSSLLPHAARPKVARTSTSRATTLRERMRRILLGVWFSWESLRPRGVTARWSAEKMSSAPIASSAIRIAVPRRPASPWTLALMIGTPSVLTPT